MGKIFSWLPAIIITVIFRTWLLLSGAVPFNGDEAVVALMARHITQGARPLFFYGQSYMGSLDAYLIAAGFSLFGEAVWVIRVVQILLYAAFLFTAWLLAKRLLVDERAAGITVLLMSVPPVMVATYTAATLGGYGETLVFGNLILLFGYEVVYGEWRERPAAWLGLGVVGGLAFWTLGMSGAYLLPVGIAGLLNLKKLKPAHILLAVGAFVAGSLPWWIENFRNDWSALAFLLGRSELRLPLPTPAERLIGYFFLGLPTIFGFRRPWEGGFEPFWMVLVGVLWMAVVGLFAFEIRRKKLPVFKPGAGTLLGWLAAGFTVIFLGTQFSIDSTGRYFLPLYLVASILTGGLAARLSVKRQVIGVGIVAFGLLFNAAGVYRAAAEPDGLTTQFAAITRFNNDHDAALMAFLQENGLRYGYSNYWVTFRLAFLSGETLIYSPRLPYKDNLSYTVNDNRYPAYDAAVSAAARPAFITTLNPVLDGELESYFSANGVSYREAQIGPYHVYHDLSETVRPENLVFINAGGAGGSE